MYPRKRFGQHFLTDPGIIQRIVDEIHPRDGERLVEIGPGLGAITRPLLERAGELHVIELDRDLIPRLEAGCAGLGTLHIHQADALRFDLCGLVDASGGLRVIGNLPYNISTPLLFHFLDCAHCLRDVHVTLQREVVERMAASPGSKVYGRLTVMLASRCTIEPLFYIGAGAFSPPPKVESAFVRMLPLHTPPFHIRDYAAFARVVARAFSMRRKTLRNSLRGLLGAQAFAAAGVDPAIRPEALEPGGFARLANQLPPPE